MRVALGSDHGGFELKQEIIKYLEEKNIEYKDYGCYSTESTDYPIYAKKVAHGILDGECELGILVCGTGIGISITANKIKGIRAAVCTDCFTAEATRLHNDANILALCGVNPLHACGTFRAVFSPVRTGGKQRPAYGAFLCIQPVEQRRFQFLILRQYRICTKKTILCTNI